MKVAKIPLRVVAAACALAIGAMGSMPAAQAQAQAAQGGPVAQPPTERGALAGERADAIAKVEEAVRVVQKMKGDPEVSAALQEAQGVFVVTSYMRAGLGVGVRGGEGIMMVNRDGDWSNPAFYNFAGLSAGVQAGAEAGSIAMILNNAKAVDSFMQRNNWSLGTDAGLTVVNWSERLQNEAGRGDITVWSDARGIMGSLAVAMSDIHFDEEETGAFYGRRIALQDIFNDPQLQAPPQVAALKEVLPGGASQASGASGGNSGNSQGAGSSANQE